MEVEEEEIRVLLKENFNFEIRSKEYDAHGMIRMINVQEISKKALYTLMIYSQSDERQWKLAKRNAFYLSKNVAQRRVIFKKEFYLGRYFVIQLALCEHSLQPWILLNQDIMKEESKFLKVSSQIVNLAQFFYMSDETLPDFSMENIMKRIDQQFVVYQDIKESSYNLNKLRENYENCLKNNRIFSYPLSLLERQPEGIEGEIILDRDIGVYQIGIILYALSGATNDQIMNFLRGKEKFQIQYNLSLEINILVAYILLVEAVESRILIPYINTFFGQKLSLLEIKKFRVELGNDKGDRCDDEKSNTLSKEQMNEFMDYFVSGVQYYYQNNFEEALKSLNRSIEIYPDSDICLQQLGLIYAKLNLFKESIESIKQAVSAIDFNSEALSFLGEMYEKVNEKEEARQHYKSAILKNVRYRRAQFLLCLHDQPKLEEEQKIAFLENIEREFSEIDKKQINILKSKGGIVQRSYLKSSKMLELFKPSNETLCFIGQAYIDNKQTEEAELFLMKVIDGDFDENYSLIALESLLDIIEGKRQIKLRLLCCKKIKELIDKKKVSNNLLLSRLKHQLYFTYSMLRNSEKVISLYSTYFLYLEKSQITTLIDLTYKLNRSQI